MSLPGDAESDRKRSRGKKSPGLGGEAGSHAEGDDAAQRELDAQVAKLPYEEALEQLEAIIDRVEHGEIGLEATLAEYRRGRALLRRCQTVLDTAEQEIRRLSLSDVEAAGRADHGATDDAGQL